MSTITSLYISLLDGYLFGIHLLDEKNSNFIVESSINTYLGMISNGFVGNFPVFHVFNVCFDMDTHIDYTTSSFMSIYLGSQQGGFPDIHDVINQLYSNITIHNIKITRDEDNAIINIANIEHGVNTEIANHIREILTNVIETMPDFHVNVIENVADMINTQ